MLKLNHLFSIILQYKALKGDNVYIDYIVDCRQNYGGCSYKNTTDEITLLPNLYDCKTALRFMKKNDSTLNRLSINSDFRKLETKRINRHSHPTSVHLAFSNGNASIFLPSN